MSCEGFDGRDPRQIKLLVRNIKSFEYHSGDKQQLHASIERLILYTIKLIQQHEYDRSMQFVETIYQDAKLLKKLAQLINMAAMSDPDPFEDYKTVRLSLQLINTFLLGSKLGTPTIGIIGKFCQSTLQYTLAKLAENADIQKYCHIQLVDLNELISGALYRVRNISNVLKSDPSRAAMYDDVSKRLKQFVGCQPESDEPDWGFDLFPESTKDADKNIQMEEYKFPDPDEDVIMINVINKFHRECGWIGFLDLYNLFHFDFKMLLKQYVEHVAFMPPEQRFPLVRGSMTITNILYDNLHISEELRPELETARAPSLWSSEIGDTDKRSSAKSVFPTISWTWLHFAGVCAFMRMWTESSAALVDFENIADLMRIMFDQSFKNNSQSVQQLVSSLKTTTYKTLRELQFEALRAEFRTRWATPLRALEESLRKDSLLFVREQRIRAMLSGDWFRADIPMATTAGFGKYNSSGSHRQGATDEKNITSTASTQLSSSKDSFQSSSQYGSSFLGVRGGPTAAQSRAPDPGMLSSRPQNWYYVVLSPNRERLHYKLFEGEKQKTPPELKQLSNYIEFTNIEAVEIGYPKPSTDALNVTGQVKLKDSVRYFRITVTTKASKEKLSFCPDTEERAATWYDGLRILAFNDIKLSQLSQKYVDMFVETKKKLHLMNFSPVDYFRSPADLSGMDSSHLSTDFYYK